MWKQSVQTFRLHLLSGTAARDSVQRARHKLKSFKTKYDNGEMTLRQVKDYVQSQVAYFKPHNDHIRILKIKRLYYALFLGEREN